MKIQWLPFVILFCRSRLVLVVLILLRSSVAYFQPINISTDKAIIPVDYQTDY